jgi:hypothetical protein
MLRLCFYHPRVTCMKWKNLYVTRVTSGRVRITPFYLIRQRTQPPATERS